MNVKPLLFTAESLLELINLARVKKGTIEVESFVSYLKVIKFILQENTALQKLIIEWLFEDNYLTSIEMKNFERFNGD
jgi:hypothetical protein